MDCTPKVHFLATVRNVTVYTANIHRSDIQKRLDLHITLSPRHVLQDLSNEDSKDTWWPWKN